MRKITLLFLLLCTIIFEASSVTLNLDYSHKDKWNYSVEYTSECIFTEGKSVLSKKTNISGKIRGLIKEDKSRMDVQIGDLQIQSDLYDSSTTSRMKKQISTTDYSIGLINGYPAIDTEIDLSSGGMPEWNIYMQLARLIPDMPQQSVKKGFSWERNAVLPVQSAQGKVSCEIYRLFKIDKISSKQDTAYISWKFKYSAAQPQLDSSSLLKYVPIAGTGTGKAIIDVINGQVVSASMEFKTPVANVGKVKVNWKEKAVLNLE